MQMYLCKCKYKYTNMFILVIGIQILICMIVFACIYIYIYMYIYNMYIYNMYIYIYLCVCMITFAYVCAIQIYCVQTHACMKTFKAYAWKSTGVPQSCWSGYPDEPWTRHFVSNRVLAAHLPALPCKTRFRVLRSSSLFNFCSGEPYLEIGILTVSGLCV